MATVGRFAVFLLASVAVALVQEVLRIGLGTEGAGAIYEFVVFMLIVGVVGWLVWRNA